jgi:GNAT superfamily N-acetyltransferase
VPDGPGVPAVPAVRKATAADVDDVAQALGRAFHDDPVMTWLLPDPRTRTRRAAKWFALQLVRFVLPYDACWTTDDRTAAALWAPPGQWRVSIPDQLRILPQVLPIFGRRIPAALRLFNHVEAHHPTEPHYYLAVLGTDPPFQGKGLGSALLAPVLEACDREGLPAYLESSKERNVPFYARHGFTVTHELDVPGGGPRVWLMWREPHAQ